MRKSRLPTGFKPAAFGYRSTALPLELEKTSPRMLSFGYLNPTLFYDFNIKSIMMFLYQYPKAAGSNTVERRLFRIACFK